MKNMTIKDETLINIAEAIREKTCSSDMYKPTEMAAAIRQIQTGAVLNIAYGDTAPEDKSKLWVKTTVPNTVRITSKKVEVCAAVETKVCKFGGYSADSLSVIQSFNSVSKTFEAECDTVSVIIEAAEVDAMLSLFRGYSKYSCNLPIIKEHATAVPLDLNTLLIEISHTEKPFVLMASDTLTEEVGIANVYMGNAKGYAEKVSAAIYKNGDWVEI